MLFRIYGVPCKNGVAVKSSGYIPFSGNLMMVDTQGLEDPTFELLGSRFQLVFVSDIAPPTSSSYVQTIPLDAVPSQSLKVTLDLQNCTISIYEKPTP